MLAAASNPLTSLLPEPERLVQIAIRLGILLGVVILLQQLANLVIGRVQHWVARGGSGHGPAEQRATTLAAILRRVTNTAIALVMLVYGLAVLGFDTRPLLAGAGIIGVALGFGAQALVRDFIAGVFILLEDQFSVGDLIEVNGKAATVERLTLRCTTLRDFNGYLHFVPNGEMKIVTNRSRGWTRLAVDIPVGSDQDHPRALGIIRTVVAGMNAEALWRDRVLDPVDVWGIEAMGPTEVQVRVVVRGAPGDAASEVARELRRRLVEALGREGIRLSASRDIDIRHAVPPPAPAAPPRT
jgi:moderate conductance mechanosensitive channel